MIVPYVYFFYFYSEPFIDNSIVSLLVLNVSSVFFFQDLFLFYVYENLLAYIICVS